MSVTRPTPARTAISAAAAPTAPTPTIASENAPDASGRPRRRFRGRAASGPTNGGRRGPAIRPRSRRAPRAARGVLRAPSPARSLAGQHARDLRDALLSLESAAPWRRSGPGPPVSPRESADPRARRSAGRASRRAPGRARASARSFRPTTSAVRPPIPASTSSKTSVRLRAPSGRRGDRLDRELQTRQLPARGDLLDGLLGLPRVRREEERRRLETGRPRRSPPRPGLERDPEPRLLHRERRGAPFRRRWRTGAAAARRFSESFARRPDRTPRARPSPLFSSVGRARPRCSPRSPRSASKRSSSAGSSARRSRTCACTPRTIFSRRVSIAVSRSGIALDARRRVAGGGREIGDPSLQILGLLAVGCSRAGSIAASSANARAASPSRSAADASSSDSAASAVSPARRIRSACASRLALAPSVLPPGPRRRRPPRARGSGSRAFRGAPRGRGATPRARSSASRAAFHDAAAAAPSPRAPRPPRANASRSSSGASAFRQLLLGILSVDRDERARPGAPASAPTPARPRRTRGPRPSGESSRRTTSVSASGRPASARSPRARASRRTLPRPTSSPGPFADQIRRAPRRRRGAPGRPRGSTCRRPSRR